MENSKLRNRMVQMLRCDVHHRNRRHRAKVKRAPWMKIRARAKVVNEDRWHTLDKVIPHETHVAAVLVDRIQILWLCDIIV